MSEESSDCDENNTESNEEESQIENGEEDIACFDISDLVKEVTSENRHYSNGERNNRYKSKSRKSEYAKMSVYHPVDEEIDESDLEKHINDKSEHKSRKTKAEQDPKKSAALLKYVKKAVKEFYEEDYSDLDNYIRRKGRTPRKADYVGISDEEPDAIAYTFGKDDIAFDIDFLEKIEELAKFAGIDSEEGIKATTKYIIAHELYHNAQPTRIMRQKHVNELDVELALMELYTEKALRSSGEEKEINAKLTHLSYIRYLQNYSMLLNDKGIVNLASYRN
ncbi:MAG: hypothetical protein ACMXYG_06040 [Candidatus Woesearchaeota archaeon]